MILGIWPAMILLSGVATNGLPMAVFGVTTAAVFMTGVQ